MQYKILLTVYFLQASLYSHLFRACGLSPYISFSWLVWYETNYSFLVNVFRISFCIPAQDLLSSISTPEPSIPLLPLQGTLSIPMQCPTYSTWLHKVPQLPPNHIYLYLSSPALRIYQPCFWFFNLAYLTAFYNRQHDEHQNIGCTE